MTPAKFAQSILSTFRRTRKRLIGPLIHTSLKGLSSISKLHPQARLNRHGVEKITDIAYQNSGNPAHLLDVYCPLQRTNLLPIVLYIHGGGFTICSKETHWLFGLAFARHGNVVFNINYRLAPHHRYPAAVDDVCAALIWILDHAEEYGGDPFSIIICGESAGANLSMALVIAACYQRPETLPRAVWDRQPNLLAVMPACGIYQVTDVTRFGRDIPLPAWVEERVQVVAKGYLPYSDQPNISFDLADPVVFLEKGQRAHRDFPPFFISVGDRDLLFDDSKRLYQALAALGASCKFKVYPGGIHGFQGLIWKKLAQQWWQDVYFYLDRINGNAKNN